MLISFAGPHRKSLFLTFLRSLPVLACLALSSGAMAQTDSTRGMACLQLVEVLSTDGRVALQGVTFDFNRATLRPESLSAMTAARDAILTLGGSWGIEGHTDTVGSRGYNQALSEARARAVRDWLIAAGVPAEQLSAQGFSFDRPVADNSTDEGRAQNRRVELVGTVTPDMLGFGGPDGLDPCPDTLTAGTRGADAVAPPIPDWSGAGGQEWLPFSLLMATGYGGDTGWSGDRIEMRPSARPESCQPLCAANADCAAFSFEPAGSNFVENARCTLIGYGTELNLVRNNSYYDGGTFYTSGLKPDARLLTPDSEAIATEIIADLAEIARLRDTVRITAPEMHAPDAWMDVAVDGAVPSDAYPTYLEVTLSPDYDFDWRTSKSALFVPDMADGRSGQIWVPEAGEYILRYVIDHPTAGLHTIAEQSLVVLADAPTTGPQGSASLSFPMVVAPGESISVTYSGPLNGGDWVDIITQGDDSDMSGGWSWAYAEGAPVTLTAPDAQGEYTLRYIAEDPLLGRVVLVQDTLVVRAPVPETGEPITQGPASEAFMRCDGSAGPLCEITLPEHDLMLTLAAGYGMTEPLIYETAGGARADRPSFDVLRLSDGEAVIMVNARQVQAVYCQDGLAGDQICLTHSFNDSDGGVAALVFGSLASGAMLSEPDAMSGEDGPLVPAGDLQGVWFFSIDMPGSPDDQAYFIVAELMQNAGDAALQGSFVTAPDLGPLTGQSGDLAGVIAGEALNLTMTAADGEAGLLFTGSAYGSDAYRGTVQLLHSPDEAPTGTILSRIAGPGEAWEGAPWMKGEADGMEAAMQIGQQALADMLGDLDLTDEESAVVELLGGMMGATATQTSDPAAAATALTPEMHTLEGIALDGMTLEEALILFAPQMEANQ